MEGKNEMHFNQKITTLLLSLFMGLYVSAEDAPPSRNPWAALIEVNGSKLISSKPIPGNPRITMEEYEVTVALKGMVPESPKFKELTFVVKKSEDLDMRLQNWFPLEKGGRAVLLLAKFPPTGADIGCLSIGDGVDVSWKDCERLERCASLPDPEKGKAIAKVIKEDKATLGIIFFRFISDFNSKVYTDKEVAQAFAEYLQSDQASVNVKEQVIATRYMPLATDDPAIQKALAKGIVKTIVDWGHKKESVDNMLERLFGFFISKGVSPDLDEKTRVELRRFVSDEWVIRRPSNRKPLADWLNSLR